MLFSSFSPKLIYEGISVLGNRRASKLFFIWLTNMTFILKSTFFFYVFHSFCEYLQYVLHITCLIQQTWKTMQRLPLTLTIVGVSPMAQVKLASMNDTKM